MMGLCLRYVGDRETARDMLQDGFVKVFASLNLYAGAGSLDAWMQTIFVNCSIEHLRKKDFLRDTAGLESIKELSEEETAVSKLSADRIMELVRKLPNGARTVFNLYVIEGYSHKEIGEMLQITESSSRSQYARARQWLREEIERNG
jgi:RNA polymerase sigma-70 factor (ECF subfamily)